MAAQTAQEASVIQQRPGVVAAVPSRVGRNIAFLAGGQVVTWGLSLLWTNRLI